MKTFKQFISLHEQPVNRRDFLRGAASLVGGLATSAGASANDSKISVDDPKLVDILINSTNPEEMISGLGSKNLEKAWDILEVAYSHPNYTNKREKISELIRMVKSLIHKRDRDKRAIQQATARTREQGEAKIAAQKELPPLAKKYVDNVDGFSDTWGKQLAEKLWYYEYAAKLTPGEVVQIMRQGGLTEAETMRALKYAAYKHEKVSEWLKPILK